jgi:hypothetical protein
VDNAAVWLAIEARALTDTGAGGLFNAGTPLVSGIFPNVHTPDANFPWITYDVADVVPGHAFNKDVFTETVRFSVYVPMESRSLTDPQQRASDIIKRIYGNWSSASPATAPTYGFHRHPLVVTGGTWTSGGMLKQTSFVEHEDGVLHFIEQYLLALRA